jgi:DNA-binding winged helix-turn-helix (wHTH) protein
MQTYVVFPPFQLDLSNEQLQRHTQVIALRPKTFAVLRYLVEHPGVLVTKDAVLNSVWSGTVVSDAALKTCVRELRHALGDDDETPRFIETVHGRGYRFLPALTTQPVPSSNFQLPSFSPSPTPSTQHPIPTLVGRESELALLHAYWEKARQGERQVVFVTGEPGIGKTSLIESFLFGMQNQEAQQKAEVENQSPTLNTQHPTPWISRGQCIEHYGAGEAYMPVLEALGRLCREPRV